MLYPLTKPNYSCIKFSPRRADHGSPTNPNNPQKRFVAAAEHSGFQGAFHGQASHQTAEIVNMLAKGAIVHNHAQAIIEGGVEIMEKSREPSYAPGFRAEVIYNQPSYADLKKDFNYVYEGYENAEFKPIDVCKEVSTETREIEFELVHLDKRLDTDAILAELDRQGLRPALYEELLALAKQYPDERRNYPIAAFGSVCRDDADYLYLPYLDGGRNLLMGCFGGPDPWTASCRFLAVRKPSLQNSDNLEPNHYRLLVTYTPLPDVATLKKMFSKVYHNLFDGRAWTRHKSCAKIDETPGEREFLLAEIPADFLGKRIHTIEDDLFEHYDRLGYRFAIHVEAVEFANAEPELQRKNWIYALGSSTLGSYRDRSGQSFVTSLGEESLERVLCCSWTGLELDNNSRFLLIRK